MTEVRIRSIEIAPGPATLWLEGVADEVLAMRVPRRSAALRAEPVALSQAKPAAAIARGEVK